MEFEYCALTDIGRLRENNEDAVVVDPDNGIVILADGMGGYSAGEVASAMAVVGLRRELLARLPGVAPGNPDGVQMALMAAVGVVNREIFERASSDLDCAGMGTTVVATVLWGGNAVIGHAGDSRAYLWRGDRLRQITRDHSWMEELRDLGLGNSTIAANYSNLVTRALGVQEPVQPDVSVTTLVADDTLLLCSDGLSNMLDDADMAEILRQPIALRQQAGRLIELANAYGGHDNISVALVRVTRA